MPRDNQGESAYCLTYECSRRCVSLPHLIVPLPHVTEVLSQYLVLLAIFLGSALAERFLQSASFIPANCPNADARKGRSRLAAVQRPPKAWP